MFIVVCGILTFWSIDPGNLVHVYRQVSFLAVGIILLVFVSVVDYRIFKNYSAASLLFFVFSLILLTIVLASKEIRGASSWLYILGLRLEPSEFAKLALVIVLAKYFSQKHVDIYNAKHIFASGLYAGIPIILTLLQPDLGSTLVFVAIWLAMLFFSGIKRSHLMGLAMLLVIVCTFAWFVALKPYQKSRILTFLNPYRDPRGAGYNAIQARTTFGSGRLTGTFFKTGDESLKVLVPEPYTDFTFAAFGQKFGFIGAVALLAALFALVLRILSIIKKTNNNFAKLFGLGFITIIFVHVAINGGMNLGIMPITGIPFPFLSYGGSHLLMLMLGMGVIQSIQLRTA
jgi:rod shape determining protein RodA